MKERITVCDCVPVVVNSCRSKKINIQNFNGNCSIILSPLNFTNLNIEICQERSQSEDRRSVISTSSLHILRDQICRDRDQPHWVATLTSFLIGWSGAAVSMWEVWYAGPGALKLGSYDGDIGA